MQQVLGTIRAVVTHFLKNKNSRKHKKGRKHG